MGESFCLDCDTGGAINTHSLHGSLRPEPQDHFLTALGKRSKWESDQYCQKKYKTLLHPIFLYLFLLSEKWAILMEILMIKFFQQLHRLFVRPLQLGIRDHSGQAVPSGKAADLPGQGFVSA